HRCSGTVAMLEPVRLTIKSTAPVPAVYLRKAGLTLKIKNLLQLSSVGWTTSSLLVPTNIPELAVYPDISPQYIQVSVEGSAEGVSEVWGELPTYRVPG
ncbi:MAG TPA: hypothetical protein VIH17_00385, partial [Candidatus Acidoferrales bacterium]